MSPQLFKEYNSGKHEHHCSRDREPTSRGRVKTYKAPRFCPDARRNPVIPSRHALTSSFSTGFPIKLILVFIRASAAEAWWCRRYLSLKHDTLSLFVWVKSKSVKVWLFYDPVLSSLRTPLTGGRVWWLCMRVKSNVEDLILRMIIERIQWLHPAWNDIGWIWYWRSSDRRYSDRSVSWAVPW